MEKKYVLTINDEIVQYCKLNNIEDVVGFGEKLLTEGYTKLKYPKPNNKIEKPKIEVHKKEENKNIYEE